MSRYRAIALLVLSAFAISGCATRGDTTNASTPAETEIIVLAAASLTQTFTELANQFEANNSGVKVTISFAGSSTLAEQIRQGAPVDVFASASDKAMAGVEKEIANSKIFATNRVVIAYPRENLKNIFTSKDLNNKDIVWIQCDRQVPCGGAADAALSADGVTGAPSSLEPDVNSVLIKLLSSEVDAAIVYLTDVVANPSLKSIEFGGQASATTTYPIGIAPNAPRFAQDFMDFVLSVTGQNVLTEAGFGAKTK